jgi:alkylation response protein AidB-like acyl-CoA dehydrogenase
VSHNVQTKIEEAGTFLAENSDAADELGRLPDETGKMLRECGVVRLLQPADFGGYEADPRDFLTAVMDVGNWCPSAGWVAGVVGVHPWELAFNDRRLQEEVWGEAGHVGRLAAAPSGTAVPVDKRLPGERSLAVLVGHRPLRLGGAGAIVPGITAEARPAGYCT